MNLKILSDDVLLKKTTEAAAAEKNETLVLLEYLAEVDIRRLYNARGYSTLWEYVHRGLGYSEAQASERISAMRLMRKVPEVRTKLAESKLTLTSAAKLASFVRRENCASEKTLELLERVLEKSTREVERVLISEQTIPAVKPDVMRAAGPETTRISFDADPEFMELFKELKNLQGRPDWSMCDRLKDAMKERLRKMKSKQVEKVTQKIKEVHPNKLMSRKRLGPDELGQGDSPDQVKSKSVSERSAPLLRAPEAEGRQRSRYIPVSVRHAPSERSGGQCEFVDPKTEMRCESRFGLQWDHRQPYAQGGNSEKENIRHLCANHNQFEAIRVYGEKKMADHLKT